jgi:flagellar biosynthesis/type III secretory pathway protein FliH
MSEEGADKFVPDERLTQNTYRETAYEDASWEVVGQPPSKEEFLPEKFPVLGRADVLVDPMFADFGGLESGDLPERWHLPEGVGYYPKEEGVEAAREEENRLTLKEEEYQRALAEAHEKGKEEGALDASIQYTQKLQEIEQRLNTILQDIVQQVRGEVAKSERDSVQLALSIAEKLLGTAVEINPEYIVQVVKEGLTLAGAATIYKIRVSTEDMEFIEVLGISRTLQSNDSNWTFEADSTIRAGCVLETSAGEVDFRLDAAFERIKDAVMKASK